MGTDITIEMWDITTGGKYGRDLQISVVVIVGIVSMHKSIDHVFLYSVCTV